MCSDVLQTCSIAFEFIVIWCILGIHFSSSVYNVTQAWREVGLGGGGESWGVALVLVLKIRVPGPLPLIRHWQDRGNSELERFSKVNLL